MCQRHGLGVWGSVVENLGFGVRGLGYRDLESRVSGFWFRIWGFGLRVSEFGSAFRA